MKLHIYRQQETSFEIYNLQTINWILCEYFHTQIYLNIL